MTALQEADVVGRISALDDIFEKLDTQDQVIYTQAHLFIKAYEAAHDPSRAYEDSIREQADAEYAEKGSAQSSLDFARLNLSSVLHHWDELLDRLSPYNSLGLR
jgi:hypothetical protein